MITEDEFETLQIKLGNKGTRRKKKKDWPYNGQMACGTCGSAVLMEEHWQIRCPECKKKFALAEGRTECLYCKFPIEKMNTQPLHYVHVRCGKTKKLIDGSRCPERSVPLDDFEENINDILVGLEIPKSFTDWAIKWLKILHKEDTKEHEKDLKRVNRMYPESDTQLRNLILMRANREIDEKEFKEMKITAKKEKKKWEDKRHALEQHTDKWIDELEKIFNFATHARYWFAKGDMDTKRTILSALGSNLKLKDRKLRIEGLNPFLVLQDMKKTKDYESVLFELSEKPDITAQNTTSISAFPSLLSSRVSDHSSP